MAARKPTTLNAPATVTAIQLAQNGTSTPFKVTDHPITIRINCRSAIRAKMAAASVQKVLMVIARLRWHTRTCSSPAAKMGRGRRGGHSRSEERRVGKECGGGAPGNDRRSR